MSRPTIRDVAELAGVSISVASNALNNKGRVSVETRRRVQRAAQELEYVANYSARRLRGSGDRTVGVLVGTGPETLVSSRYFRESLQALGHTFAGTALKLHFIYISPQSLDETLLQQIPSDGALDGAMVIAPALSQIGLIAETWAGFLHVLLSASPNLADVSYVDSDGRACDWFRRQRGRSLDAFQPDHDPPALTEMGARAATYLIDRLNGRKADLLQEILPVELIVRDSCGARLGTSN